MNLLRSGLTSIFLLISFYLSNAAEIRKSISLNSEWKTVADDFDKEKYNDFNQASFNDKDWKQVNIPHNWDKYEGYRRLLHGNRHGYAWYRKTFKIEDQPNTNKKYFLFFEGVGSYATVWLNGKQVGYHAGGRTTFTLDISKEILLNNQENILAVRADHPAEIRDLPWVDGGCSSERGFSEGSQPMGIFRPVQLIVTNNVKVEPFGVHIWNDEHISEEEATLHLTTEIKNYGSKSKKVTIKQSFLDAKGNSVFQLNHTQNLKGLQQLVVKQQSPKIANPILWDLENPYLYTLKTQILENNQVIDEIKTPYGIRWVSWPLGLAPNGGKTFMLNGKTVFLNGIAEYEHLIGNSHAFSDEQVYSRASQMKSAGFNSFREGHQPHNLRYQEFWDANGVLLWTQLSAHIWFDNPAFKKNFKSLLIDWVKERRNSPSVILWGLQNESTIPEDFARECTELIRSLDPTASKQRLVTTCNGGKGTDWDVPQNWTGTYGGSPAAYGEDLKRQVLVGEYGAWRTLDLHSEGPHLPNVQDYNEDRFTHIMETKVRLADSVKNEVAGHYFWLWTSHDNPGRVQGGEGLRELDRVGPVNYKGLLTPWEELTDALYMFKANFASKQKEPMLYIASHTWPERWNSAGIKNNINIYSNCDEVALMNDIDGPVLARQKNPGLGKHFVFNNVFIKYNVLYAVGYVDGKAVAKDVLVLNNLTRSPNFEALYAFEDNGLIKPTTGLNYIYRYNCGGGDYTDQFGNVWLADRRKTTSNAYGSSSWTNAFPGIPAFFASQRRTFDPISNTRDWGLFQEFRYGRDELKFEFEVPDGEYQVELFFIEPWLGTGGGTDASKWRLFDIAVNDEIKIKNLDIWKEARHDQVLKKVISAKPKDGKLMIHFPNVKAGQALISAIAIATKDHSAIKARPVFSEFVEDNNQIVLKKWADIGNKYSEDRSFSTLTPALFGSEYLVKADINENVSLKLKEKATVYLAIKKTPFKAYVPQGFDDAKESFKNNIGEQFNVYIKRAEKGEVLNFEKLDFPNDILFFNEVNGLQPAYDLKTATTYKANTLKPGDGIEKIDFLKQDRLIFRKDNAVIEFEIKVGVADVYSLTFKYHNPFKEVKTASVEVVTLDGMVLKPAELIQLDPTREGKWNYFNTNTGTMINAGTYKVRLKAIDAKDVYVDGLDVQ